MTTTQGHQPDYGEPNGYTASVNGTSVYGYTLYRDPSGNINHERKHLAEA